MSYGKITQGLPSTKSYKIIITSDNAPINPLKIPLYPSEAEKDKMDKTILNFVCEIPSNTSAKMELEHSAFTEVRLKQWASYYRNKLNNYYNNINSSSNSKLEELDHFSVLKYKDFGSKHFINLKNIKDEKESLTNNNKNWKGRCSNENSYFREGNSNSNLNNSTENSYSCNSNSNSTLDNSAKNTYSCNNNLDSNNSTENTYSCNSNLDSTLDNSAENTYSCNSNYNSNLNNSPLAPSPVNFIHQDTKNGNLRHYFKKIVFNYGFLPMTFESPFLADRLLKEKGDSDPLDAIEIGPGNVMESGEVRRVKILGALGLIDQGEADWKVLVMDQEIAREMGISCFEDLVKNENLKVKLEEIKEFLVGYKVHEGKDENMVGMGGEWVDEKVAMEVVEESREGFVKMFGDL